MKLNIFINNLKNNPIPIGGFLFFMLIMIFIKDIHNNQIFIISSLAILILGMIDDFLDLTPFQKLFSQIAIVLFFVLNHYNYFVNNIFLIFCIVFIYILIMNASNIIDGLDGLLFSTSLITFSFIMLSKGNNQNDNLLVIIFSLIIVGMINLPPAKIYFGDSGAMLIGFLICYFTINNDVLTEQMTMIRPVKFFPLPVIDVVYSIIRRMYNRQHIFKKDKLHIHHCLIKFTNSKWKSLLILSILHLILVMLSI